VRLAWDHIGAVEQIAGKSIGQGNTVADPPDELLEALTNAYRDAAKGQPAWNGRDFYVAFGDGDSRSWDDAVEFGFVSAGGGEWYSKTLRQLKPGHRLLVYIPKGNGVGGYVGAGNVVGEARLAKDFTVQREGQSVPYLEVARAAGAGAHADDPGRAEWIVPVEWLATRKREEAIKDSDFFANQNSAVKLTHGYTLERLVRAFDLEHA
jgi:hypothetical protein